MSLQIGFIILSHSNPQQLLRLVRTLQRGYDNPPIACHHDFTQCPIVQNEFPSEVRFVSPHVRTRWGWFSIVTAALRALDLLYQHSAPDWFVLLSGADYPTMRSVKVLEELKSNESDALLDYREIYKNPFEWTHRTPANLSLLPFGSRENQILAWRRYMGFNLHVPIIRSGPRIGRYTVSTPFEAWRFTFGSQFKCFFGDQWFAGNQKVAKIFLNPTNLHLQLRRYLRWRIVPDECYYQTVLCNTPTIKINAATRRFCKWRGDAHPQILGLNDLQDISNSNTYFARKFPPDSPALDEIDKMLS